MGKWSTILKYGKRAVNSDAARTFGGAVIHPQRTLRGFGTATKTAVIGGGTGYLAWQSLVNDKPVARTVADVIVGEKNVDKAIDTTGTVVDKVEDMAKSTGEKLSEVNKSVSSLSDSWSGISRFLGSLTSGHGLDMLGGFFGNLTRGNVSGMSIFGLVASAFLVFGRFGWLGKIGGLLMSMMLIGNNSRLEQQQGITELQSSHEPMARAKR